MIDKAWSKMNKKYRNEREIITLSVKEYDYLMKVLTSEFLNSEKVADDEEEEETMRSIAFGNVGFLKKYIDLLVYEVVLAEDGRVHVPFYKDFGNDLFLFLLANATGGHYII